MSVIEWRKPYRNSYQTAKGMCSILTVKSNTLYAAQEYTDCITHPKYDALTNLCLEQLMLYILYSKNRRIWRSILLGLNISFSIRSAFLHST